ncbi:hypothetical protein P7C73_g3025, partial [Tremellales sp. Uapishka_1]
MSVPIPFSNPTTPIPEDDDPHVHSSPSFDYHDERRMHLKDEIWMSHHLARLPPPSLSSSTGSLGAEMPKPNEPTMSRVTPSSFAYGGERMTDRSPSAFHPRPLSKQNLDEKNGLQFSGQQEDHEGAGYLNPRTGSMLTPSTEEDGDMDPAGGTIHRTELDVQERLDLEEEAAARALRDPHVPQQPPLSTQNQTEAGG